MPLRRILVGEVVSTHGTQTCIVRVERTVIHPKYHKRYHQSKKYSVHDPLSLAKEGMTVEIEECKPISKTKKFRLLKIVK